MYNNEEFKDQVEETRNSNNSNANNKNIHRPSPNGLLGKNYRNLLPKRQSALPNKTSQKDNSLVNKLQRKSNLGKPSGVQSNNDIGDSTKDGLPAKDDLNKNSDEQNKEIEQEQKVKENFIQKRINQKKKLNLKEKEKDKVKKVIIKKVVISLVPFLGMALLLLVVGIIVFSFFLVPGAYLTNKMNETLRNTNAGLSPEDQISMEDCKQCYEEVGPGDLDEYLVQDEGINDEIDYEKAYNSFYKHDSNGTGSGIVYSTPGDVAGWRQGDPKWANHQLGDSSTIGRVGCLMTSVAIQIARTGTMVNTDQLEGEFSPDTFNTWLRQNNGYSGNNFVWNISKLTPNFIYQGQIGLSGSYDNKYNSVKKTFDQGYVILLELGVNQHWVAVTDVKDDQIYMIDPNSDSTNAGDKYYKLQYANCFAYYKVVD